jgi:hypothetical protein
MVADPARRAALSHAQVVWSMPLSPGDVTPLSIADDGGDPVSSPGRSAGRPGENVYGT